MIVTDVDQIVSYLARLPAVIVLPSAFSCQMIPGRRSQQPRSIHRTQASQKIKGACPI
jgi:hypothetical protein